MLNVSRPCSLCMRACQRLWPIIGTDTGRSTNNGHKKRGLTRNVCEQTFNWRSLGLSTYAASSGLSIRRRAPINYRTCSSPYNGCVDQRNNNGGGGGKPSPGPVVDRRAHIHHQSPCVSAPRNLIVPHRRLCVCMCTR